MDIFELFFIAVGLSMDAFAVSICKGLSTKDLKLNTILPWVCGLAVFRLLCRQSVTFWAPGLKAT